MNSNIYEEKRKFNIVDALIIILIAIMVSVIVFRAQLISLFNDSGAKKDVEISFVCEAIPNEILPSITDKTTLTWVESDVVLGTLSLNGNPKDAEILYYDTDGDLNIRISDTEKSFKGVINGKAIEKNGCYIDGTDFLASGMTITLTNGKAQFTALITDVTFEQ